METTAKLTAEQLEEIRKRADVVERGPGENPCLAEKLAGEDVPALLAALEAAQDALALSEDGRDAVSDLEAERWQARLHALEGVREQDASGNESGDPLDYTADCVKKALDALNEELADARNELAGIERMAELLREERDEARSRLADVDAALAPKRAPRRVDAPAPTLAEEVAELIRRVETAGRSSVRNAARVAELEGALAKADRACQAATSAIRENLPGFKGDIELLVDAQGAIREVRAAAPPEQAPAPPPTAVDGGPLVVPLPVKGLESFDPRWTAEIGGENVEPPRTADATPPANALLRVAQGLLHTWDEKNGDGNTLAPAIPQAVAALRQVVEHAADVGADVRTCDTCRHHRPNAARRCGTGCGWAPLDVGAAPPASTGTASAPRLGRCPCSECDSERAAAGPDAPPTPSAHPRTLTREQLLDADPLDLDLTVRASNGIQMAGIKTVRELVAMSYADLAALKNMGARGAADVVAVLDGYGLALPVPSGDAPSDLARLGDMAERAAESLGRTCGTCQHCRPEIRSGYCWVDPIPLEVAFYATCPRWSSKTSESRIAPGAGESEGSDG